MAFEQWDVVVVPFPFSDGPTRRRRPAPSVVRLKIFTLDDRLVERRVGALGPPDASAVRDALGRLFGGLGG